MPRTRPEYYIKIKDSSIIYNLLKSDIDLVPALKEKIYYTKTSLEFPYVLEMDITQKEWELVMGYIKSLQSKETRARNIKHPLRTTDPSIFLKECDFKLISSHLTDDKKANLDILKRLLIITNDLKVVSLHEKISAYFASILENINDMEFIEFYLRNIK